MSNVGYGIEFATAFAMEHSCASTMSRLGLLFVYSELTPFWGVASVVGVECG